MMRHREQVSTNFKGLKSQSMFSNHNAIKLKIKQQIEQKTFILKHKTTRNGQKGNL